MTEILEATQRQQRHEMADVQRIRRRIKAAIQRDGRRQFLGQFRRVRAIGNKTAPVEFIQNAHLRAG